MIKLKVPFKINIPKSISAAAIGVGLLSLAFADDLFLASKNLDIFASVYKEINVNYVDEVNTSTLIKTGIDAMLNELDPYTQYVQESDIEDFKLKFVNSEYDGIGAKIGVKQNKVYISDVFENYPAQKADVRVGDQILEINNISLKGKSPEQASLMLKGGQNTELKLLLKREGVAQAIEKKLTRADIKQGNIPYYGLLSDRLGYIKLDKFQVNAAQDITDALQDLQKNELKGLVLDLRDNGGGMVSEAIKIVNLFVAPNTTVALQKGRRSDQNTAYKTYTNAIELTLPLVVLINNNSASASEIVAGALQDLDRAVIIGQRSFGKGLVQQTINTPYNTLIKVTIAKYYTPSGRCIQALDYSHKAGGSAIKMADSLMTEYKTQNGRSVYDGNGLYPDLYIKPTEYHPITKVLVGNDLIFDYATKFRAENTRIGEAKNFTLTDSEYTKFTNYLSTQDYNYDTPTEALLIELNAQAKIEGKLAEIKTEFEALKAKIYHSKQNDLTQFKAEIKTILENEIVGRYYFDHGRFEHSFQYDKDLEEALKTLTNKTTLAAILKGEGSYKTIGKPSNVLLPSK